MRRSASALVLTVLALVFSAAAIVAPTAAQASSTTCHTTKHNGTTKKTCVTVRIYARKFQAVWSDGVINHTGRTANMTCTATTSKTTEFSVSATVKYEAGFIFGKVSAEVTGGVKHSVTSGYSTSAAVPVPANKTFLCDRGIYTYRFSGQLSQATCVNVNCTSKIVNFAGLAPQRTVWLLTVGH
jgi:hypothetical protein